MSYLIDLRQKSDRVRFAFRRVTQNLMRHLHWRGMMCRGSCYRPPGEDDEGLNRGSTAGGRAGDRTRGSAASGRDRSWPREGQGQGGLSKTQLLQTLPGVPNVPGIREEGQRPAQSSPRSDSTVYPVLTDRSGCRWGSPPCGQTWGCWWPPCKRTLATGVAQTGRAGVCCSASPGGVGQHVDTNAISAVPLRTSPQRNLELP